VCAGGWRRRRRWWWWRWWRKRRATTQLVLLLLLLLLLPLLLLLLLLTAAAAVVLGFALFLAHSTPPALARHALEVFKQLFRELTFDLPLFDVNTLCNGLWRTAHFGSAMATKS
jgi:hypothetical protein